MAEDNSAQETMFSNGNSRENNRVTLSGSTLLRQALEMGGIANKVREHTAISSAKVEMRGYVQPPGDHSYVYSSQPTNFTMNLSPTDDSFEEESAENSEQTLRISENVQTFPVDFLQSQAQLDPCLQTVVIPHSIAEVTLSELPLDKDTMTSLLLDTSATVDIPAVHSQPNNFIPPKSPQRYISNSPCTSLNSESETFSQQDVQTVDVIRQARLHTSQSNNITPPNNVQKHIPNSLYISFDLESDISTQPRPETTQVNQQIKLPAKSKGPLGSSDNPIQVLHQGNSFQATQTLSKAQLHQIANVLQQQQLIKAIQNGGKSELYDKATNTRILYKVICSKKNQNNSLANSLEVSGTVENNKNKTKSRKGSSRKSFDDKGKPILSKEEREEKKKHRPRTRSGRISKPPSYMVKDYKRIHHLDFNEEPYDASDGGYSDFQVSDEENEKRANKGTPTGVSTSKQRNYNCASCSKAYIGKGGLSRHYKLNPNHGHLPEGEDASTQDENSNSSFASSVFNMATSSVPGSANPPQSPFKPDSNGTSQHLPFSLQDITDSKRKAKLKEILKNYSNEEVIEACLPKLLQTISVWEFLLIKSKKGNSQHPDVSNMFKRFESVVMQMQKVARTFLTSACFSQEVDKAVLNITNEAVAKALLVSPGSYFVKEVKTTEQQRLTNMKSMGLNISLCNENRVAVDPEEILVSPPLKRRKLQLEAPMVDVVINPTLPDQILSDVTQEVENIEFQTLVSASFQDNSALQQDPPNLLNVVSGNLENHAEFTSRSLFDCGSGMVGGTRILQTVGNTTTVTPSSLSSGCLSAIDASEALKNRNFLATSSVQQLQNTQLQDVALFGSLPNFPSENTIAAIQNFSNSNSGQQPVVLSSQDRSENSVNIFHDNVNSYSQCPISVALSNDNNIVYNHDIQSNSPVGLISTSAISLLRNKNITHRSLVDCQPMDVQGNFNESGIEPGCLVNVNNVPEGLQNNTAVIQSSTASIPLESNTSIVEPERQHSSSVGVTSDGHFTQIVDEIPIVRQLVLPDGQVVSLWSAAQNQSGKTYSEQFVQEYLPENLIILQKPDGSYDVPSDQVPVEMLQTLLSGNEPSGSQQKKDNHQSQLL